MRLFRHIAILIIPILLSCEEPFIVNVPEKAIDLLVVEGQITNEPGPHQIKFSKAVPLTSTASDLITVDDPYIESKSGQIFTLSRLPSGIYETGSFQGIIGESYKLNFEYKGNEFESDWVIISEPAPIDSIYWKIESRDTENPNMPINGIQFYLNSNGENTNSTYYRWEMEETWQVVTLFNARFFYLGNNQLLEKDTFPNVCWESNVPPGIKIETTQNLSQNIISDQPIYFLLPGTRRITQKYSLEVAQYAMDENEFLYWKTIRESNEESGGLFNKQPGQIKGNIKNLSNPDQTVLGYFRGSGVSRNRVFIERDEVTPEFNAEPTECEEINIQIADYPNQAAVDAAVFELIDKGAVFVTIEFSFTFPPVPVGYILAIPYCTDCVATGGTVTKPEFWID